MSITNQLNKTIEILDDMIGTKSNGYGLNIEDSTYHMVRYSFLHHLLNPIKLPQIGLIFQAA